MLVLYANTHEEDEMYHLFSSELAAQRIADLRLQTEHDRLVTQVQAPVRDRGRRRLWRLPNAHVPRTDAT